MLLHLRFHYKYHDKHKECINLVERKNIERKTIESIISAASAHTIHV